MSFTQKVRRIFTNGKSLYLFRNMNGYEINTIIKFKGAKGYGKEKNCSRGIFIYGI